MGAEKWQGEGEGKEEEMEKRRGGAEEGEKVGKEKEGQAWR